MPPTGLQDTITLIGLLIVAMIVVWLLRRVTTRRAALPPLDSLQETPADESTPATPPSVNAPDAPAMSSFTPETPAPLTKPVVPAIVAGTPAAPAPFSPVEDASAPPAMHQFEQRLQEIETLLRRAAVPAAPTVGVTVDIEVYRLHDAGTPVREIARQLSLSRAEVDLLLALRAARDATPAS